MKKKDRAKKVKIETLYQGELRQFGDKLRGKCLFHNDEKTPNFFIFTKTNSWYCFAGCGGGDVIDYMMKLKKLDFKQALKELL